MDNFTQLTTRFFYFIHFFPKIRYCYDCALYNWYYNLTVFLRGVKSGAPSALKVLSLAANDSTRLQATRRPRAQTGRWVNMCSAYPYCKPTVFVLWRHSSVVGADSFSYSLPGAACAVQYCVPSFCRSAVRLACSRNDVIMLSSYCEAV